MTDRAHLRHGKIRRLFRAAGATLVVGATILGSTAQAAAPTIGPNYLRLTPIAFSVIGDDNKIDLEVSIVLALELKPGVTEAMVSPFQPKIQDQALVTLTDLWEAHALNVTVLTTQIKGALLPVISGVAGKDKVEQVLILGIGERRRS
jgi:hypothetical protein